ncbi:uncharacterized protein YdbL (DUF1318 family) [Glaciimonas immobilis]|uniref:Uncharacterized protein YdbL (DUF1318 family) n=1 Tax=Glaciimonas immobilis TaxID=728004 RepID=A0A840RYD5_9BURK|nr:uncharacterized protein YdbL (DUF1318 family) [Glaciimonas immobilis]
MVYFKTRIVDSSPHSRGGALVKSIHSDRAQGYQYVAKSAGARIANSGQLTKVQRLQQEKGIRFEDARRLETVSEHDLQ